jgi:hypothetical protein
MYVYIYVYIYIYISNTRHKQVLFLACVCVCVCVLFLECVSNNTNKHTNQITPLNNQNNNATTYTRQLYTTKRYNT